MPSGELIGTTLKLITGREVTDGHSHTPTQIIVCILEVFISSPTLSKWLTRRSSARCRNSASLDARYALST
jgi:hypothetical protein